MGIDLPSAPQGHHRVAGSHGQTNKPGDASQPDSSFGFAALMSLLSDSQPESSSTDDGTGSVLLSANLDGNSAVPVANVDANANVNLAGATVQAADAAVVALPGPSQMLATPVVQADGKGLNQAGLGVAALGRSQPKPQIQPATPGTGQRGIDSGKSTGGSGVQAVFDRSLRMLSQPTSRGAASTSLASQTPPLGVLKGMPSTRSQAAAQVLTMATATATDLSLGDPGVQAALDRSSRMLNQLGSSGVVSTPLAFPTSPPATLNEVIPTTSQVVPQVLTTPTNTALSDPGVQAVFDRSSRRPSQPTSREAASTSLPIQTPPLGMQYEIASTRSQVTAQASTRLTELVPVAALAQGQLTQVVHSLGKEEATQEVTSVQFVSSIPAMPPDAHLPASTPMPAESVATAALWPAADLPKLAAKPVLVASEPNPQVPAQAIAQTSIANPVDIPVAELVPKPGGASTSQQTLLAAQARQDSNQFVSGFSAAPGVGAAALPGPALVPNAQEAGVRMSERPVKHAANRFGSDGEAVYGQALATANSADAQFPVSPTSSAAASTTLAETVSHWASQGVHSASLQLDGFGDEPVEVRISVNGDMAQVDFRTNQPEVRHAIEGAASQLKDLLSGQGMQLAGMSIGTSARGAPQDKYPRHLSDVRKVSLVKSDIVEAARVRGVNPSVGQSLDLFV